VGIFIKDFPSLVDLVGLAYLVLVLIISELLVVAIGAVAAIDLRSFFNNNK
jgi:hypothetical protein